MFAHPPAAVPNYFAGSEIAARYVRPFIHDQVAKRLRAFAGVHRFRRVLDVGCGSGQSSIALAAIADSVIALDASYRMLNRAVMLPNISYQLGVAEQLDFAAAEFDLVSVSSALHWFDQDRFFAQCQKVMAPAALLAVYNDHFTARMHSTATGGGALPIRVPAGACTRWMRSRFVKNFPPSRRGMRDIDELKVTQAGFQVAQRSSFTHLVPFFRPDFIAYLLTCSNTLAVIHSGKQTLPSVADWLDAELAPILPDGITGSFLFKCNLWLLRRATAL